MTDAPTPASSAADTWLREAFDRLVQELKLFGRTFTAFVIQPGRSARDWQAGERTFMNPLGFAAAAAGVYWAFSSVLAALWPVPGTESTDTLARQLTSAAGPYLHYGLLGIAMDLTLRLLGSRRHILASIGTSFFAGGSVGTLTALLLTGTTRWIGHARGVNALELQSDDVVPLVLLAAAVTSYALICLAIGRALIALHRTAAWKMMVAAVFAVVVTALLFGSVLPEGKYGWHPYIRVNLDGHAFAVGFRG